MSSRFVEACDILKAMVMSGRFLMHDEKGSKKGYWVKIECCR